MKCARAISPDGRRLGFCAGETSLRLFRLLAAAVALGLFDQAKILSQVPATDDNSVSTVLTCHISGIHPIPPTDVKMFKGSDVWVRVGINSKLGGVATTLDLINPSHPEAPLCLIDNRSAAGAAWQSCIGVVDARIDCLVHYNQSCGNSDQNWGYVSTYDISDVKGIIQKQWLPLFSNDYKHPASPGAPAVETSPCPDHKSNKVYPPMRFGDGRFSIVPELVKIGSAEILRLTDNYSIRPIANQSWKEFDFDQCLYLMPGAVGHGNLHVYLAQEGHPIVGPIRLWGDIPVALKKQVQKVSGNNEDWFIGSHPLSYAVLVFNVAGRDIGIAIHQANKKSFSGFLRFRPHLFSGVMAEEGKSSHQWHFGLRSNNNEVGTMFRKGEISTYSVQYDIAPVEQLAAEGFQIQ